VLASAALEFGAERVVVVALNSLAPGPAKLAGDERPDALEGAGQILSGLLGDQLTSDVQTLATINTLTRATRVTPGKKRRVGQALINLGRQDARRWLGRSHDLDGLWQIAPSAAT
jgi:hypothetical protein